MAADACNGDSIHSVTKRIPGVGRVMFYYFTPNDQDIKKPSYPGNLDGDRRHARIISFALVVKDLSVQSARSQSSTTLRLNFIT